MSMVILVCQFGNETNTFSSGLTEFNNLVPDGWVKAETVIPHYAGTSTFLGGALDAITEEGETAMPIDLLTPHGNFGAGPVMSAECAKYAMDNICRQMQEKLGQYDGIYFAVHGAGCSEIDEDLERYTLSRVREIVGPDMPIMSSLDLHANLSHDVVGLSSGIFCIKENPHTDSRESGYLTAKMLIAKLRGEKNPVMALRRLPLLVSPAVGSTLSGMGKEVKEYFANYCKEHDLLDCSFIHGFSATDRESSSASVLVVADGYAPEAEADELANYVWERRDGFAVKKSFSAAEAFDEALRLHKDGYVVINEGSDNPGSGGPGDATHLLREMLKRDRPRTIMGPMFDPETAEFIHEHKVGDKVTITLGGKKEPVAGEPLYIEDAEILNLSNGNIVIAGSIGKGAATSFGKSARLRKGNVEFIVVSKRIQTYDDRPFIMTGVDMALYDIIGLKSMNHFRGYFAPRADALVAADTPGIRPANVKLYDYKNVVRPIFPLDEDTVYDGVWPK